MRLRKRGLEYEALQPNPYLIGAGLCAAIIGAVAVAMMLLG